METNRSDEDTDIYKLIQLYEVNALLFDPPGQPKTLSFYRQHCGKKIPKACRYLIYSEADFEVFRPAGATRCTHGGEIWHGGGDLRC